MAARHTKINRVFFLLFVMVFIAGAISLQLFYLQVLRSSQFLAKADVGHLGYSEVSARRGEILIQDHNSGEVFRLATNSSAPLLYADPTLIKDPSFLADKFSTIIFDVADAKKKDAQRIRQEKRLLPDGATQEQLAAILPRSEEDMRKDFRAELGEKLSQKQRQSIILYKSPPENIQKFISESAISGIEMKDDSLMAYPPRIGDPDYAARVLSPVIDIPFERLSELLKGRNRYVVLMQRIPGSAEQEIRKLMDADKQAGTKMYSGIGFQERSYRYYPEGSLAAQIVGYVSELGGAYGIEQSFDATLRGKKGVFKTKLDATGQQVIVGDDLIIQPAIDGAAVTLTIDRSVQLEVEKRLAKTVKDARADSGMVIIMEPSTGKIISVAHYPTFDPNSYSGALETEDINLSRDDIEKITTTGEPGSELYYWNIDPDSHYRIQVFKSLMETGRTIYSKYKNILGPGVFRNRAVTDIYEPGSVFKAIAMAIALDDGDVTPQTTFNDTGPIEVDEFTIHNATSFYGGITTMTTVLEKSLNTGMAFVARRMGRELYSKYLKRFGFGQKTEIEFEGESAGQFKEGSRWAESELVTYAFGQGIAVTPIQLITAVSALANGGILMKPQIIEEIRAPDDTVSKYDPEEVRRVISEKASATITAMLVNVVANGGAARAQVPGYHIAGKTGTAQTYKHGIPLTGPGTTIASFIGYAPIKAPKFAILVKIDRPRASIWADASAAPLFGEIAAFLFKYYNIAPDY